MSAGTFKITWNEHEPPAGRVPPVSVRVEVPSTCEPVPQASLRGVLPAIMPGTNASRSSLNVSPATALAGSGLVIWNIAVVVPPTATRDGSKDLVKPSGSTRSSALAGCASTATPSRVPVATPVVLVKLPAGASAGTRTGTTTVHEAPAARLPPVSVTIEVPASCEPAPQTSACGRPSATRPARAVSRSSFTVMPVSGNAEPLTMEISISTRPAGSTGAVRKDLVTTNSPDTTSIVSLAGPLLPDVDVRSPLVLTNVPSAVPVMSTWAMHVAPAATLPPLKLTLPDPGVALIAAPQVFDALAGLATSSPAGSPSTKPRLPAATALAELSIVKVSVLAPSTAIALGWKTLPNVGGGSMTRAAEAGSPTTRPALVSSLVTFG